MISRRRDAVDCIGPATSRTRKGRIIGRVYASDREDTASGHDLRYRPSGALVRLSYQDSPHSGLASTSDIIGQLLDTLVGVLREKCCR